jgi:hypothetical protein
VHSTPTQSGRAPLKNMSRFAALIEAANGWPEHLPRMVCFSGWSGYGKSFSAAYAAQEYRCCYVEARSHWTRRTMMEAILRQLGAGAMRFDRLSVSAMALEAAKRLVDLRRPLIIDEFDSVVDRGLVELVRDLYEQSRAVIALVGEEALPTKLEAWERFHGRVGGWAQASPCDLEDTAALATLYCPGAAEDLLDDLRQAVGGSARRITTNLNHVRDVALIEGWDRVALADWGERGWNTGAAPAARAR